MPCPLPSHRRLHIQNYRSPGPVSIDFGDHLSELFDQLMPFGLRHIVCGDLDCAGQRAQSLDDRLHDVLQRHNERQLTDEPTHVAGNVLDVLIVADCWTDLTMQRRRRTLTVFHRSLTDSWSTRSVNDYTALSSYQADRPGRVP